MSVSTAILTVLVVAWIAYLGKVGADCVRRQRMAPLSNAVVYHLLFGGAIMMGLPFYWMVIASVKSFRDATAYPPRFLPTRQVGDWQGQTWEITKIDDVRDQISMLPIPTDPNISLRNQTKLAPKPDVDNIRNQFYMKFSNYKEAWYGPIVTTFGQYFWVSIFTAVTTTIGTLLTGAFAAFAFAKMRFIGKGLFFYIIIATMMVPGQVLLIPSYIILQYLGWLDTYLALIVPWLASVFTIFLMRQFFMTIPDDLWDAAQIDGSSRFRFLFMVVLPLSKPVMITAGIFTFLGNWNSLLWPLIVTTRPEMRTIMVGLSTYNQEAGSDFHLLMAASAMAIFPVVVAFFFLQKFFIAGIARTGLK